VTRARPGRPAEVIVVGAGIAGLSCARALADAGVSVRVVDQDRRVGGRCATHHVDRQPVDSGLAFFHGTDPGFLAALEQVEGATRLEGWPVRVAGKGAPCQPRAFEPHERRLAFAEGVSAFPEHLARGLEVRLDTVVERLAFGRDGVELVAKGGERLAAPIAVVALPVEGTTELGLAGELFAASGGAQAAWRSGADLAARIVGKEPR
jgi:renalase